MQRTKRTKTFVIHILERITSQPSPCILNPPPLLPYPGLKYLTIEHTLQIYSVPPNISLPLNGTGFWTLRYHQDWICLLDL